MSERLEKQEPLKIEIEILPGTLATLESIAHSLHVSLGETVDRLAGFYWPDHKQRILTELADLLDSEYYR